MTNDDKDLKPCPFCGQDSAICNQDDNGLWYVYCNNDFCFAEITEVTSQEAVIEKWNTRHPQQPSEDISLNTRPYNPVPSFAKGIKDALNQPSEKKALSVEDMKKIMWDLENKLGYQPAYETIAQAIFDALPARKEGV